MRKEPEYYLEIGYEDHGYVSPELSSSDIYPDYIKDEVKRCVEKIQSHQNKDTITFAFMTDLHYALSYNHDIRMKRTINAYKEIAKRAHINKLILGGDYTNEACKQHKSDCYRELRALFEGITYYPVNGNHDDGTIWDHSYINKTENWTNYFTHKELYTLFYNHLKDCGAKFDESNPDSLYYTLDDTATKTRYVCMDANDIPYILNENGRLLYSGQYKFAMSQAQLNWLINDALKFDEDGWDVLFFTHSVALPGIQEKDLSWGIKHLSVFNNIVDTYKNGGKISGTYYEGDFEVSIDADFSGYKRGNIAGVFVGDYHYDEIEKSKSGIPYILTGNAVMYWVAGTKYNERRDGDKTELLFDIVVFDKNQHTFNVIRVGAGEDREVSF